jgi:PAT family beta-lactamase induction signal transducer AmpG
VSDRPPLRIYLDRRILTICALGIISGLPWSLTHTTLGYWLTTEGISMKTVGLFALTSLPYALKFLWAPLFDLYHAPLIKRGRSGWMALSQIGIICALVVMSRLDPRSDIELIAIMTLITSFFAASQDIAVDGWRVDVLNDDEQGVGASLATLGYRVGMYISSAGALLLSSYVSWEQVYLSLAYVVALGILASLFSARLWRPLFVGNGATDLSNEVQDSEQTPQESAQKLEFTSHLSSSPVWLTALTLLLLSIPILILALQGGWLGDINADRGQLKSIVSFVKRAVAVLIVAVVGLVIWRSIRAPKDRSRAGLIDGARSRWGEQWLAILCFVCVFRLGDHLLGLFLFPSLAELKFTSIEIATVAKSWGLIATLLGTMLGGWLVYSWGLMRVMVIAGLAQALSNLTLSVQALLGHNLMFLYVSIGVQDLALGMVNATFVAYISSLCDRRYAATHFAFLSSLSSVLKTFVQAASGWVVVACKDYYGDVQKGWALYFALTSLIAVPGLVLLWHLTRRQSSHIDAHARDHAAEIE